MTAELAVMNKKGVAIAADSAVTLQGDGAQKIFTSANKIFQLSKYEPVGVMVYQDSGFLGVPWDTIIKLYREQLGEEKKDHLKSYAEDFLTFLENSKKLFSEEQKTDFLKHRVAKYYHFIEQEIGDSLKELLQKKRKENGDKEITIDKLLEGVIDEVIDRHYQDWEDAEEIESLIEEDEKHQELENKYKDTIVEIKEIIFEDYNITSSQSRKLTRIAFALFTKFCSKYYLDYTGIVFTGYGREEIFPSLVSYKIEGLILNILKYKKTQEGEITYSNRAAVYPFAQSEMVSTFMEGIEPNFKQSILNDFRVILQEIPEIAYGDIDELDKEKKEEYLQNFDKDLVDSYRKAVQSIHDYTRTNFSEPIVDIVANLPKPELASMAKSLVNLTTLRRKISKKAETVGGPIDVAVISKGDGFIWINRKHYFEKELNHHFFETYYDE